MGDAICANADRWDAMPDFHTDWQDGLGVAARAAKTFTGPDLALFMWNEKFTFCIFQ